MLLLFFVQIKPLISKDTHARIFLSVLIMHIPPHLHVIHLSSQHVVEACPVVVAAVAVADATGVTLSALLEDEDRASGWCWLSYRCLRLDSALNRRLLAASKAAIC